MARWMQRRSRRHGMGRVVILNDERGLLGDDAIGVAMGVRPRGPPSPAYLARLDLIMLVVSAVGFGLGLFAV